MQIYEALMKDHRKVEGLLDRLVALGEREYDQKEKLVEQIRDELIPHARAEEAVFYNSIRAVDTAKDLVWHGYAEHMEAEALLRTLQAAQALDVGFKNTALKLKDAVTHHIKEEEQKIMPVARQLFTNEEAVAMTEAFESMKPEVREGGILQSTIDMIANVMPPRLAAPLRTFNLKG